MISALVIIVGAFLLIVSAIDLKVKAIPSIFLTGMIFVVLAINQQYLIFGILSFVMAYLMYEGEFFGGVADIKIMTLIGLMIPSLYYLFAFIVLLGVYGLAWKGLFKIRLKGLDEVAFIPVFFFCYLTLVILGGIR